MNKLGFNNIFNIKTCENENFLKNIQKINEICKSDDKDSIYLIMNINKNENTVLDNKFFIIKNNLLIKGKKNLNKSIEKEFECELETNIFKFNGQIKDWSLIKGELIMNDFKYNGTFNNNLPNNGKILYTNGDVYEGVLNNGQYNGNGILKTNDLNYIGNFENNKFMGAGFLTQNNIIYEVNFLNNKKHGDGILTEEDNKEYSVVYDNDVLIEKISLIELKYNQSIETIKNLKVENCNLEEQKNILETEIKKLKNNNNDLLCKICFEKNVQVVFRPCGHLCACKQCTDRIFTTRNKVCPVCRKIISSKIDVLIS